MAYTALPYTLSIVTEPSAEPLTLAEAKLHVREDQADNDSLIRSLIAAARQHVEAFTGRALMPQTWDVSLDEFPAGSIWLPKAPLVSVTSVSYLDVAGDSQVWSTANYSVHAPAGDRAQQGRVSPNYSVFYPVTLPVPNAVTVRFVAGYASAARVPEAIKSAMKLLIGHWYGSREAVVYGQTAPVAIPVGVDALLWPYKVF